MERDDLIIQVMFKPNCGLENTRAALVARRILPLCDEMSYHPRTVKSDRGTISYLRDHGLFIRFKSSVPEQVLLAVKGSFFVDGCTLVSDADAIPPYAASGTGVDTKNNQAFSLPSIFAEHDDRSTCNDELTALLGRFEKAHRALKSYAASTKHDRELDNIVFSNAQAVDGLRTAVARSRIEPFDRIAPSLRTLVEDYGQRFGVLVDLDIADGHMALDRSVLASMEEIIKHAIRSCIRDGIGRPDERMAANKPPRATMLLRLENDGSDVVCRIEHDGNPFDLKAVGRKAYERGLLARPLETYTDEEIGAFLLLPGFAIEDGDQTGGPLSQFNEIGSMMQHVGGRGRVRHTDRGTIEIMLNFPVPFTVIEATLVRTGDMQFALPAQQIRRFEAFRPERIDSSGFAEADDGSSAKTPYYISEDGERYELINGGDTVSPFETINPTFVLVLDAIGRQRCLLVDAVDGYERISVNQLPSLLQQKTLRDAGCIGYTMLESGSPCIVVSVRRLLSISTERTDRHA